MARDNSVLESEDKFDLTSMIDVVFLLLIYFMYLPLQQEADLLFSLPAMTAPQENVALPSEQIVDIAAAVVLLLLWQTPVLQSLPPVLLRRIQGKTCL